MPWLVRVDIWEGRLDRRVSWDWSRVELTIGGTTHDLTNHGRGEVRSEGLLDVSTDGNSVRRNPSTGTCGRISDWAAGGDGHFPPGPGLPWAGITNGQEIIWSGRLEHYTTSHLSRTPRAWRERLGPTKRRDSDTTYARHAIFGGVGWGLRGLRDGAPWTEGMNLMYAVTHLTRIL